MKHVLKKLDYPLLLSVIGLSLFGLLMIYDASSFISARDFHGDKYHYVISQALWMIIGFVGLGFFSLFNYKKLYTIAIPLLLGAIGLLLSVMIPGIGVKALGAYRWINLGFFILQPAELVKLILAIYLSAWFSSKEKGRFPAFVLLMSFVLGLVMFERDMGTAIIVLAEALVIYFLSGGNMMYLYLSAPVLGFIGWLFITLEPFRAARLTSFFAVNDSIDKTSYHVRQILIALGLGGFFGVGLGNSLQKFAYLPENTTDSIFAIIAEELGFLGGMILLAVFLFVIWRGFVIAVQTKDPFGRLLAGGITSFLALQMVINLGAQTALFPLTGVPLPFISYGGSALVVDLCSIGILLHIGRQNNI